MMPLMFIIIDACLPLDAIFLLIYVAVATRSILLILPWLFSPLPAAFDVITGYAMLIDDATPLTLLAAALLPDAAATRYPPRTIRHIRHYYAYLMFISVVVMGITPDTEFSR